MWRGYEPALILYGKTICVEWVRRSYRNNIEWPDINPDTVIMPEWFGDDRLNSSHRAALLAKFPLWYMRFSWKEEPGIHYWWPTGAK
jgi:hypothetical protein